MACGIYPVVEPSVADPIPENAVYCIACKTVYAKPADGGRSGLGASCPHCGYIGWIAVRLASDPPRRIDERPTA